MHIQFSCQAPDWSDVAARANTHGPARAEGCQRTKVVRIGLTLDPDHFTDSNSQLLWVYMSHDQNQTPLKRCLSFMASFCQKSHQVTDLRCLWILRLTQINRLSKVAGAIKTARANGYGSSLPWASRTDGRMDGRSQTAQRGCRARCSPVRVCASVERRRAPVATCRDQGFHAKAPTI